MMRSIPLLLFFCFSTVYSQELEVIKIQNDTATIVLETVDVSVQIVGNIATTVTEMTFYNPNDRVLEGELNFPLAENQSVFRFALDIGGKLREGVAVEKNQGRRAFEGVVRQNIDPALLEMTAGNNYKARIYPIPAKGTRTIVVGVEEELKYTTQPLYQLALNYGKVGNFHIKVEVLKQTVEPKIKHNDLVNFQFKQWNQAFIAEYKAKKHKASGLLSFEIPKTLKEVVYREKGADRDFFYVLLNPEVLQLQKKEPAAIAIVWDASSSAQNRDLDKEIQLLEKYLNRFEKLDVTIIQFSDKLRKQSNHKVVYGNFDPVIAALKNVIYDGGTNFNSIDFSQLEWDEILLFSDGITNLGALDFNSKKSVVNTICSSAVSDVRTLKYLANTTGGSFVNLLHTSIEDAQELLTSKSYRFLGATFNDEKISQVFPSQAQNIPPNSTFSVSGRIKKNYKSAILLNFGVGGQILETKEVWIDHSYDGASLSRLWAHKQVAALSEHPLDNSEAIVRIGKKYGLVTPHTSLIVLDRVEDYVRYGIVPPDELKDKYNQLIALKKEAVALSNSQLSEAVLEEYEERVEWWTQNLKDSTPHIPKNNQGGSNHSSGNQNSGTEVTTERHNDEPNTAAVEAETRAEEPLENPSTASQVSVEPTDRGAYDKIVTGTITSSEDGSLLPGVNVIVKGTARGTITDINGEFHIAMDNHEQLVISFIGYTTEQLDIGNKAVVDVALGSDITELSEVVVTAIGVERSKQSLGFSVTEVNANFQGQMAGVQIKDAAVVIRGNTSVKVGSKPIYVIDGVVVDQSEFDGTNPAEIVSMNVIKGDNATVLYGSQAADGVIVITTKDALEREIQLPDSITNLFEQTLVIKDWSPDEPYLDTLENAAISDRYTTYLELRKSYANTPSFYLSVGSFFMNQGQQTLGLRILSNLAELDLENYELLKMLAHKFRQLGEMEASIYLFQKIAKIREGEPHSLRDLALTYQAKGDYQKALALFNKILLTNWSDDEERFPKMHSTVLGEMNNLISLHAKELDLSVISKEFIQPMPLDIRVVLEWNTLVTDLDLWVTEPNGEKCYYKNMLTMNGGRMVEDYMDGYGPEEYLLKNAQQGEYTIEVEYYDERVQKIAGPTTLQVTIFTNYGRKNQKQKSITLQLKNEKETVEVGTFDW